MSKSIVSGMYPEKPTSNIYLYGTIFVIVGSASRLLAVVLADAGYTGIATVFAWVWAVFVLLLGVGAFAFLIGIIVIMVQLRHENRPK